jgi:hypothetical protein
VRIFPSCRKQIFHYLFFAWQDTPLTENAHEENSLPKGQTNQISPTSDRLPLSPTNITGQDNDQIMNAESESS